MATITGSPDGYVVIDTRINTQGFGKGASNLKTQFTGLAASAKKLGGIIGAAFSIGAVIAYGKEAINLGSDLQEVQNVVDVTFTSMNDKVNEFAKNAIYTAGLSETMAKRYTGTFGAMAKSFKFTEEEAFSMATALTQLSGDVASFYNLSQDAAYTKLKSVFTGETESLKDLGVVMTQTALDDFAMRKGFAKTTAQMSEQEKVALRYQFVLEQLSAASGDFIRTSDSWANQTRILAVQFDALKATIGQGLISALTPVVKLINTLLLKLREVAGIFSAVMQAIFGSAGSEATETAKAIESVSESTEALGTSLGKAGKKAEKFLAPFDEINKISTKNGSGSADSAGSYSGGATIPIAADVQIGEDVTPNVQKIVDKILELIEPLRNIDFTPLRSSFEGLGASLQKFGGLILDTLGWAWDHILLPLAEWTIEEGAPAAVDLLSDAFSGLSDILRPVINGLKTLWVSLEPVFAWIGDHAIWVLEQLREQFDKVAQVFRDKGPQIERIFSKVGDIVSKAWKVIEPILNELKKLAGIVFDYFGDKAAEQMAAAIDALEGFVDFFSGVFSGDWKAALNGLISVVNALISGVIGGINSLIRGLNRVKFEIPDWVPSIGGKEFGLNIQQISAPKIPYLAKGAVIPPNAPFMAMLGDQRHGMNIETPEGLLRKIVQEELSGVLGGMDMLLEALLTEMRENTQAVRGISIGDDEVGRAAARYLAKMKGVQAGK